ncbi:MAG: NAD(P)H-hydrate dehydratase [Puniceicoccaceae bacterium]|nr:NAD(P)H-hydrate dehydratase [Puniceicoccaceae bacterium]
MHSPSQSFPVLSAQRAKAFEVSAVSSMDEEWFIMQRAGRGIAQQVINDYKELRPPPEYLRILVIAGKGHNGGDAMLACNQLLGDFPRATVTLLTTCISESMKPMAKRAYEDLKGRVSEYLISEDATIESIAAILDQSAASKGFDICLDGLLGIGFVPPIRGSVKNLIEAINGYKEIGLRAAVDMPSGLTVSSESISFCADFTYATGIVKELHVSGMSNLGRVHLIDLGFFDTTIKAKEKVVTEHVKAANLIHSSEYFLSDRVLDPVRRLRRANVDKRTFGHLFIVGGSAYMPGALLMAVQAAVRSGVGLVTAFAPTSIASSLAGQVPEAMWIPWPESSNGTLYPRAIGLLMERIGRASAMLIGPGMGSDRNTEMIAQEVIKRVDIPIVCDADALRNRAVELVLKRSNQSGPVVLTPHMGEFMRIAKLDREEVSTESLLQYCQSNKVITVLKGPITQICDGQTVWYNSFGGPVLSRGGSGDMLAGLIGGLLAQNNNEVTESVAQAVVLHGQAAEYLAREEGQVTVQTTQVLDFLSIVLRGD